MFDVLKFLKGIIYYIEFPNKSSLLFIIYDIYLHNKTIWDNSNSKNCK